SHLHQQPPAGWPGIDRKGGPAWAGISGPACSGTGGPTWTGIRSGQLPITRRTPDPEKLNPDLDLPYELRLKDFELAMQDVYDFFYDVNLYLSEKGLHRLDDMLRPAAMSGLLSDMLTSSMAKHSRVLVENRYHNGHPDLIVNGVYP